MVQKVLAGVGALLSVVGVILLIVVSVTEDFVIAIIPGAGSACTEDKPFGTLGVFTATLDPACAQESTAPQMARFAVLEKAETPTTEFWPLFPAQQNFGGAFGELGEFTTCEEYYTSDALLRTPVLAAAFDVMDGLSASVPAGANQTIDQVRGIFGALPGALTFFAASNVGDIYEGAITQAQGIVAQVNGALGLLRATVAGETDCTPNPGTETLAFPQYNTALCGALLTGGGGGAYGLDRAIFAEIAGGATAFSPAVYAAFGDQTGLRTALGLVGLHLVDPLAAVGSPNALISEATADTLTAAAFADAAIGGVNTLVPGPTADFGNFRAAATQLAAIASVDESLNTLAAVLNVCPTTTTLAACVPAPPAVPDLAINPGTLLDDTAPLPFCVAAIQDEPFASAVAPLGVVRANCTYANLLLGFTNLSPAFLQAATVGTPLEELTANITDTQLAGLAQAITQCTAGPLTTVACGEGVLSPPGDTLTEAQELGPLTYSLSAQIHVACVGLGFQGTPCPADQQSVRGIINATITDPTTDATTRGGLNGLFNGPCNAGVVDTIAECQAEVLTGPVVVETWAPLAGNVLAQALVPADLQERIDGCEDDLKDIEIFEQAQAMLPAAMALSGIGAVFAAVAAALNKTPIAIIAGVLSIVGGALTIGALLLIQTAPVYELVGGEETPYSPFYQASSGQLLALLGGVLPLLGGVAMAVSALLNRPGSESAMTSKVDNTY